MLIALSGWARSGKDSCANVLVARHGFRRVAFADKLKELALALDPWLPVNVHGVTIHVIPDLDEGAIGWFRLSDFLKTYGPEDVKKIPAVREFYQRIGEKARTVLWDSLWIDAVMASVDEESIERYIAHDDSYQVYPDVVFSDLRYRNEAEEVRKRGGQLWRIERPGVGPANDHASENDLNDWDFDRVIRNDSTHAVLADRVTAALKEATQ